MRDESIVFILDVLEKARDRRMSSGYNGKLEDQAIEALRGIESTLAQRDAELAELREKNKELEQRLEAAERDSSRYRWLRNTARSLDWTLNNGNGSFSFGIRISGDQMDRDIDAELEWGR